jgi:hypothetical protein
LLTARMTEESLETLAERVQEPLNTRPEGEGVVLISEDEALDALAALTTLLQRAQEAELQRKVERQLRKEWKRERDGAVVLMEKAEARERKLREALDRLVDAAEPFVPETRYSDELGDVLEGAIEIAREALRSLDSEGDG